MSNKFRAEATSYFDLFSFHPQPTDKNPLDNSKPPKRVDSPLPKTVMDLSAYALVTAEAVERGLAISEARLNLGAAIRAVRDNHGFDAPEWRGLLWELQIRDRATELLPLLARFLFGDPLKVDI